MTTRLMEDWLQWLDRRMRLARRHILLFLDNAPSHPKVQLKNVKIQFLPANTTSVSQPMDQGIIQTMKLKYRKRQLQHVSAELDRTLSLTGPQILRGINILQAIYWVNSSWKETQPDTITKCFKRCGFLSVESDSATASDGAMASDGATASDGAVVDDDDDMPLVMHMLAKTLFDCDLRDIVNMDREFATCDTDMSDWDRCARDIINESTHVDSTHDDSDDEAQQERDVADSGDCDLNGACERSLQLQSWALTNGHSDVLDICMKLQDSLNVIRMKGCALKQKSILEFFSER